MSKPLHHANALETLVSATINAVHALEAERLALCFAPEIAQKAVDISLLRAKVMRGTASLPREARSAVISSGATKPILGLECDASVSDVISAQQMATDLCRGLAPNISRIIVGLIVRAVVDVIESNPDIRNDPMVLMAYHRAHRFTCRVNETPRTLTHLSGLLGYVWRDRRAVNECQTILTKIASTRFELNRARKAFSMQLQPLPETP